MGSLLLRIIVPGAGPGILAFRLARLKPHMGPSRSAMQALTSPLSAGVFLPSAQLAMYSLRYSIRIAMTRGSQLGLRPTFGAALGGLGAAVKASTVLSPLAWLTLLPSLDPRLGFFFFFFFAFPSAGALSEPAFNDMSVGGGTAVDVKGAVGKSEAAQEVVGVGGASMPAVEDAGCADDMVGGSRRAGDDDAVDMVGVGKREPRGARPAACT
jgi:hypothetical protein